MSVRVVTIRIVGYEERPDLVRLAVLKSVPEGTGVIGKVAMGCLELWRIVSCDERGGGGSRVVRRDEERSG